jgi:2',3'-cyclic-nucleotide 2'-phosphodiesterase (5'-nucleotidase family)
MLRAAAILAVVTSCAGAVTQGAGRADATSPGGSSAQGAGSPHLGRGRWLRILAINDFHGALEPRREANGALRGGAVALAAEISRARAECRAPACVSLLLDGGDEFQGTPASNLAFGRPVVELFSQLGVAAAALGNHEFDWGQDTLRARMRGARYAILGANVRDSSGGDVAWIPNDTIVRAGPLRVGIVGVATTQTPKVTRPSNVADLRFVDPGPIVDAAARDLRRRGAQLVVVVAHEGAFCNPAPSSSCSGEIVALAEVLSQPIDAIVSGHTHSPIATIVHGIPIVQARANGSALGVIDLPLDARGEPVVALRDVLPGPSTADPAVDSLVHRATAAIGERMRRPVARLAERMAPGLTGRLGNLIADAQRAAGQADVAIMNAGGVRAPVDTGVATYGSLFEVQPFGNVLTRVTLRGRELRSYLERIMARQRINFHLSGVVITADTTRPSGARIIDVRTSTGEPIDDQRTYRLVLSDFLAAGGDDLAVSGSVSTESLGIVDIDALIAYLQAQPRPVRAPTDERLIFRPTPP